MKTLLAITLCLFVGCGSPLRTSTGIDLDSLHVALKAKADATALYNPYADDIKRQHIADSLCAERGHIWQDETAWYGKPRQAWTTYSDEADRTILTHWTRKDMRCYRCMRCGLNKAGDATANRDTIWKRKDSGPYITFRIKCDSNGISVGWFKLIFVATK